MPPPPHLLIPVHTLHSRMSSLHMILLSLQCFLPAALSCARNLIRCSRSDLSSPGWHQYLADVATGGCQQRSFPLPAWTPAGPPEPEQAALSPPPSLAAEPPADCRNPTAKSGGPAVAIAADGRLQLLFSLPRLTLLQVVALSVPAFWVVQLSLQGDRTGGEAGDMHAADCCLVCAKCAGGCFAQRAAAWLQQSATAAGKAAVAASFGGQSGSLYAAADACLTAATEAAASLTG